MTVWTLVVLVSILNPALKPTRATQQLSFLLKQSMNDGFERMTLVVNRIWEVASDRALPDASLLTTIYLIVIVYINRITSASPNGRQVDSAEVGALYRQEQFLSDPFLTRERKIRHPQWISSAGVLSY